MRTLAAAFVFGLGLASCKDATEMEKENSRHVFDKHNERLHEATPTQAVPAETCYEVAIMLDGEGKAVCPQGTWLATWHQMSPTLLAVQCKCFTGPK